ncbi:MAG: outer membrane lipoprotein-sorting protein, partial [Halioglobus sp.]|nr:outer membrane lipoprotein-sorting protein [Halioglobus sp.]
AAVESVVRETMANMWRPITLTTVTTMCGFMGLYLAAIMPPFKYFGLFATLGVFIAWLFSMLFLPAALVLTRPQPRGTRHSGIDAFSRIANGIGQASLRHARVTLALAVAVAAYGLWAASKLQIEEDRIDLFHPAEAIYQADKAINRHMDGTSVLYIVVESPRRDGLLDPDTLRSIAALQHYALSLPNVGGTSSIVDYLEQMHGILDPDAAKVAALPDTAEAVAQYLFVYSALADPTDFEEEIDYEYRNALVRVSLKHGSYLSIKPVVEALQTYIDTSFTQQDLAVTLSGRVSLNYHWFKDLGRSHFSGLALALLLVWATTALLFRSPLAGLFALVPVGGSVLLVYASMVTLGMNLGIGSSMFAAVAIGLGVDFSIHTLDRLRQLHALHGGATHLVYAEFFHTTGRALLFNFLAITCGFGVLISSKIVSLNQFGSIVVLAVSTSFIASITVLPALVKVGKPNFIVQPGSTKPVFDSGPSALALAALAVTLALLVVPTQGRAAQELTAQAVVARINAVPDGEQVTRRLTITMTDRTGRERRQSSISYRKQAGDDRKTVMFFEEPANIRGTGFLIWNYADAERDDDQWLYLPALRKARRVSTADRGGYFLGTDFTYEDMKLDGKLEPRDYNFKLLPANEGDGASLLLLEAIPRDDAIAEELGYSRIIFGVDTANWILVKAQFFDVRGEPLKTLNASDVRQVDGFWTRHDLRVENHQTGHVTHFLFSDVDYLTPVDDSLFARQSLSRGP